MAVRQELPVPDLRVGVLQRHGLEHPLGKAAFEAIYHTYDPPLTSSCFGLAHSLPSDIAVTAHELAQDTWVAAVGKLVTVFKPASPVLPWLLAIAKNKQVDRWRETEARPKSAITDVAELPGDIYSTSGDALDFLKFKDMLAGLKPRDRRYLVYRMLGYSDEYAGELDKVSLGTAKGRHRLARAAARISLGEPEPGTPEHSRWLGSLGLLE